MVGEVAASNSSNKADKRVPWVKLIISDKFQTIVDENILIVKQFLINMFQTSHLWTFKIGTHVVQRVLDIYNAAIFDIPS